MGKIIAAGRALSNQRSAFSQSFTAKEAKSATESANRKSCKFHRGDAEARRIQSPDPDAFTCRVASQGTFAADLRQIHAGEGADVADNRHSNRWSLRG